MNSSPLQPAELTPAQRRALRLRQGDMFGADAVHGPGTTLAALRRRGVIEGRQPHAALTPSGEELCREIDAKKGDPDHG